MRLSKRALLVLAPWLSALACNTVSGSGQVEGLLHAPKCGHDNAEYALDPDFFGAEAVGKTLELRIQDGGDLDIRSDGVRIWVRDAQDVAEHHLGQPLSFGVRNGPVEAQLYLNSTCPGDEREAAFALEAVAGTIVFDAIYAPRLTKKRKKIRATLTGVRFSDPQDDPTGVPREDLDRFAELNGHFSFSFRRGRPAQAFP